MDPSDEVSEQKSVVEGQTDQRRTFWERFYGALTLDATVFDEIEHDPKGVGQAAGVVAIVAVAWSMTTSMAGDSSGRISLTPLLASSDTGWTAVSNSWASMPSE